jgi:phage terminase large subunit GpA-like protein
MALQPLARDRYKRGAARLTEALFRARREALKPPPILSLSQWADRFAYLSPETSARGGKFTAFTYQNGIMDAITDPKVRQVSVMKSARVGYTKILDHVVGYFIHQDPSPILIVQPRVEDAEDYSRTEIAPMLRDTPVLLEIAGDLRAKDSNQRINKRLFRNGSSVAFVGANSPGGFRRITARIIAFDEVDGYPREGAGDEGDQIALGTKRSETFWNRKIILGSTPTVKGVSRIEKAFEESDQRRYYVPCPHCGHKQIIAWGNIKYSKDEDGNLDPESVYLLCDSGNGCVIEEHHKPWMVDNGEWIAEKPSKGHAGFHVWAGYSLFPNACWANLVSEWLRVKDDHNQLRTWINTTLGEPWEEDAEKVDGHSLYARVEDFGPNGCPDDVLMVTCGIDVQDDRIEVERVGWGAGEESWSLDYQVMFGDPSAPQLWKQLNDYLLTSTTRCDGREIPVEAACIDSGGHFTQSVYAFAKDRPGLVYAIKGASRTDARVWPVKSSNNNKLRANVFIVGVHAAKDQIYARLRTKDVGPRYCHFPLGRDARYFDQLTSEIARYKYVNGRPQKVYLLPNGRRNEALDCRVYAYAGLLAKNVAWGIRLAEDAAWKNKTMRAPVRRDDKNSFLGERRKNFLSR